MGDDMSTVSTPAYLGPVTRTCIVRDAEWHSLSIPAFFCSGYVRRSGYVSEQELMMPDWLSIPSDQGTVD